MIEYFDDTHTYLVDGIIVPSVTQLIHNRFPKPNDIPKSILDKASKKGTELHTAIEMWERYTIPSELPEFDNYLKLKEENGFEVVDNELMVCLSEPMCAGRLDMIVKQGDEYGIADIKRTYKLDTDSLFLQLNLYRMAIEEMGLYKISFLKGIHLREKVAKYVDVKIKDVRSYFNE